MDLTESYGKPEFMRRWFLTILFSLISIGAEAEDNYLPDPESESPMNETEVRETFSGKTHRGSYNFKMDGLDGFHFEEWTSETGQLLHRIGSRVDKGQWRQKGHRICYEYDSEDFRSACFSFYKRGNCIYHFQETIEGTDVTGFTAVSVVKGEVPSCEPPMS